MLRKLIVVFAWFVVFSAVISFAITLIANSLDYGRGPDGTFRAGAALVEQFGGWYTGTISIVAAVLAISGTLTGFLPGARGTRRQKHVDA